MMPALNSSVASFLVWGGGGGGGASPQMYRQKKIVHVCNLYARASSSETYIGPYFHIWCGTINDSIGQKNYIEKIYAYENCYFLQYSVGTSDTLSQKHIYFQVSNYIIIHNIQSMQFPVNTYGMAL